MCVFQRKLGHITEMVRGWSRLLLITSRKWSTPCQMRWKSVILDDVEGQYYGLSWLNGARKDLLLWLSCKRYGQGCY